MQLRERVVRMETILETVAQTSQKREAQIGKLFASVQTLKGTVSTDHAVRQAEAHRDRRTMKMAVAALTVLWTITQAVTLLTGDKGVTADELARALKARAPATAPDK